MMVDECELDDALLAELRARLKERLRDWERDSYPFRIRRLTVDYFYKIPFHDLMKYALSSGAFFVRLPYKIKRGAAYEFSPTELLVNTVATIYGAALWHELAGIEGEMWADEMKKGAPTDGQQVHDDTVPEQSPAPAEGRGAASGQPDLLE